MQTLPHSANPFALMLDPAAVFAQLERSQRLEALERRICRPLDKPLLTGGEEGAEEDRDNSPGVLGDNQPGRSDA